jgi:hypothetical protein
MSEPTEHRDSSTGPRGRKRERQSSPAVHTYNNRAASHSPTSRLFHSNSPIDTSWVDAYDYRPYYLPSVKQAEPELSSLWCGAYEYRSLSVSHIRLLCISPGLPDDNIQCALKHVPLSSIKENLLEFQALSYAWGEPNPCHMVYIDDILSPGTTSLEDTAQPSSSIPRCLEIRGNLYSALKCIREEDSYTWLWVDALCINQSSESEKSLQIPKMPEIYSNAWNVVIWLGEELYQGYATRSIVNLLPQILNLTILDAILKSDRAGVDFTHSLSEFCGLLKRPWFSRRWVIQEIACARRLSVRFGGQVLSWVDFTDAIELVLDNVDRLRQVCSSSIFYAASQSPLHGLDIVGLKALLRLSRNVFRKSLDGEIISRLMDMESLVIAASSFEVSDPQDVIYALLHLAADVDTNIHQSTSISIVSYSLVTDYSRESVDTFSDFVQHCIQTHGSLDIITRPWLNHPSQMKDPRTPTWMKQGGVLGAGQTESLIGPSRERTYNASQGVPIAAIVEREHLSTSQGESSSRLPFASHGESSILCGDYNGRLAAKGVLLGTIKKIIRPSSESISDACLRLLGWTGRLSDGLEDRLWRTLVANRTHDRKPAPAWYRRACALALTQLNEDGDLDLSELASHEIQPSTLIEYVERVRNVIKGRVFFSCEPSMATAEELVGLVSRKLRRPGQIREGDYVCVLFGCSVPVILRPDRGSDGTVRLFGEAYVHGHMEGEPFGGKTEEEITEISSQFKIR